MGRGNRLLSWHPASIRCSSQYYPLKQLKTSIKIYFSTHVPPRYYYCLIHIFHSDKSIFYGFKLWQSVVSITRAFQRRWLSGKHDISFQGACNSKTSRNKLQQKTEYIILALQAENKKFSLHHIINLSMRACRRWKVTWWSGQNSPKKQVTHQTNNTSIQNDQYPKLCLMMNYIQI